MKVIFAIPLMGFLFMLCWGVRRYEDTDYIGYAIVAAVGMAGLMMSTS